MVLLVIMDIWLFFIVYWMILILFRFFLVACYHIDWKYLKLQCSTMSINTYIIIYFNAKMVVVCGILLGIIEALFVSFLTTLNNPKFTLWASVDLRTHFLRSIETGVEVVRVYLTIHSDISIWRWGLQIVSFY